MAFDQRGDTWALSDPEGDKVIGDAKIDDPKFWWDFCEGELQTPLRSHLTIRALIHKMKLNRTSQVLELKNEDGKTIVRVSYEEQSVDLNGSWKPLQKMIELQSLRGYDEEADQFIAEIDKLGWERGTESMVKLAYDALGTTPMPYSSKPKFKVDPEEGARDVVCSMVSELLDLVRMNENGIIDDTDY